MWLMALVFVAVGFAFGDEPAPEQAADTSQLASPEATQSETADKDVFFAYYFHGTKRCATCIKLESYSHEALQSGFEKELSDSLLVWRTVNWDDEANAHFVDDYQLFTKAVILSRVRRGEEVAWKNLDSIWQLVGDKDRLVGYIQRETRSFLAPPSSE
jgi:hypothetical protein